MKKSVKFSPEVRERAVRMVAECRGDHPSQWSAIESIAAKIGCTAQTLNGKFRDECLSMEYFRNRTEAPVVIEQWRQHYNEVRPHSALGYLTPAQFIQQQSGNHREAVLLK